MQTDKNTIDQNSRQVGLGFVQGTDVYSTVFPNNLTLPFAINSSGELLIEIIPHSIGSRFLAQRTIRIDENHRQISAAVTNNVNQTITPLTTDAIVGVPCVRTEVS